MTQREELINKIVSIMTEKPYLEPTINTASVIADFILTDRARIVEPLVEYKTDFISRFFLKQWQLLQVSKTIDETIKLAGVK